MLTRAHPLDGVLILGQQVFVVARLPRAWLGIEHLVYRHAFVLPYLASVSDSSVTYEATRGLSTWDCK